ncbi:MAG: Rrf2 family transcriptional regulator [bacterium]
MLKISAQADYAIRALIDLAMNPGMQSTLAAIADRQGIPRKHLPTVFQSLIQVGLVDTVTENGGGVELAKSPDDISLRRIIEVVDGAQELYFCEIHDNDCASRVACRMRDVLTNANDLVLQTLDSISLGDLIPNDCTLPQ